MINLINVYAPNIDSPSYFMSVAEMMDEGVENKLIIGDFNLVMDVNLDRLESTTNNKKAWTILSEIIQEFYLADVWRLQNPNERRYTWFR